MDIETLALAKKYTDDSILGGGAIKGKNCVISDITPTAAGHEITFQWTLDDGTVQSQTIAVLDGVDGQDGDQGPQGEDGPRGIGIKDVEIDANNHLIITFDDDTTEDAGQIIAPIDTTSSTAQGNPISITTDSAQNIDKFKVIVEPYQDLHGEQAPWPAGATKNIAKLSISYEITDHNTIIIPQQPYHQKISTGLKVPETGYYVLSFLIKNNTTTQRALGLDCGGTFIGNVGDETQHLPINTRYSLPFHGNTGDALELTLWGEGGGPLECQIQIEAGPSASDYVHCENTCDPRSISHVNISISESSSESPEIENVVNLGMAVAGGEYDSELKQLRVDYSPIYFDGSEDENWALGGTGEGYHPYGHISINGIASGDTTALMNLLPYNADIVSDNEEIGFKISNVNLIVRPYVDDNMTLSDFKEWLESHPLKLVYRRSSSITYPVISYLSFNLLEGSNYIVSDVSTSLEFPYRNGTLATLKELSNANNIIAKLSQGTMYSQNEIPIGTWIDGRTIYRKIISFGKGPGSGETKGVNPHITNFGGLVHMTGVIYETNTGYWTSIFDNRGGFWMDGDELYFQGNGDISANDVYFILDYYKTS